MCVNHSWSGEQRYRCFLSALNVFKFGRQSNLLPLSVVRCGDVDGGWQEAASFCYFWQFKHKGINAVFEFWPGGGCKNVKNTQFGYSFSLVWGFFCPVELGPLELPGAQPYFVVSFLAWGACFDVFFKGDALRRDLYHYVCLCVLDGSHCTFIFPLCLLSGLVLHTLRRGRVVNI